MGFFAQVKKWVNQVYLIEENDPVHGGEKGITNRPLRELADRTEYLKAHLQPKDISASSSNTSDTQGHSHAIDQASTTQKGIVQLTNDTGLDSESLGLTAKAGKKLAQMIATVQQALGNYIKNDKKSDSVASDSSDNVATSKAAKTAHDKGVEALNKANDANDNANGRVSKSGDTMTGNLEFDSSYNFVRGKKNGVNNWYVGNQRESDDDIALHSYAYGWGIYIKSDRIEANKDLYVDQYRVHHNGNTYLDVTTSQYGGLTIIRPSRQDKMIIESNSNKFVLYRRDINNSRNYYEVSVPEKSGTLALKGDIAILTGAVGNNSTLPLPAGFSENECYFHISIRRSTELSKLDGRNPNYMVLDYYLTGRVVTAKTYSINGTHTEPGTGRKYDNASVNYIVIGVKK
ncbi:hypothetical protein ACT2CV_06320 [Pasteurellaceae bacterium 22721_9_1]